MYVQYLISGDVSVEISYFRMIRYDIILRGYGYLATFARGFGFFV